MSAILIPLAAAVLALVIVARCVRVLHQTTPKKHRHPLIYLGFGYSYVVLGAGAVFGAGAIATDHDTLEHVALWLLLAGSVGLIVFDRRALRCWSLTECPADPAPEKKRP